MKNGPQAAGKLQLAGTLLNELQVNGGQLGSIGLLAGPAESSFLPVELWEVIKELSLSAIFHLSQSITIWQQLKSGAYVHLIYCFLTVSIKG